MNVGLLVCDQVNKEYQNSFGDYPDMFIRAFPQLNFRIFDATREDYPVDLYSFDAFMSTGSKYSVYHPFPWIQTLKKFINQLFIEQIPFVGFCFGHQLIGASLGGEVQRASSGWSVGAQNFKVLSDKMWLSDHNGCFRLIMSCRDQITILPPGAEVLASNPSCPYGMIQIGNHFLGIQGHPEFDVRYSEYLLNHYRPQLAEGQFWSGKNSLNLAPDNKLIQSWVMEFIQYAQVRV